MGTLLSADEFLATPPRDDVRQELVRGALRTAPVDGGAHGVVADNVRGSLAAFARPRRLGRCFGGTGFLLPLPPGRQRLTFDGAVGDTVRAPDVAFVRAARIPAGGFGPGWLRFAPDLAVEVLSPSDTTSDVGEKLADYRAAGTALMWVVDAVKRLVTAYTADAPVRWLREGDALDGGAVLPGFTLAVDALFEDVAAAG